MADRPRRPQLPAYELTEPVDTQLCLSSMSAVSLLATEEITDPLKFLESATMSIEMRMPWSSNATFLVTLDNPATVGTDDMTASDTTASVITASDITAPVRRAIYKPVAGERPLWDFEPGLHRRERAAFLVSEHLGIDVVPPTVIRDGPFGVGSVQWFVEADHREHYFSLHEADDRYDDQFVQIATLDVLINNTDRKSGHCLLADERIWAIDNGLCFSAEYKLRTVIWDFANRTIDDSILEPVAEFITEVPTQIAALLDDEENAALQRRATKLVIERRLPTDDTGGHRYPWPLV